MNTGFIVVVFSIGFIYGADFWIFPLTIYTQEILIATDPSLGLTVVRPTPSGACADVSSRIPVKFGENMRTGCQIA